MSNRTYLSVQEWSVIRENVRALRNGTGKLTPAIEDRNPKVTPTQSDTIVEDLDETIRNLIDFKVAIQKLTNKP